MGYINFLKNILFFKSKVFEILLFSPSLFSVGGNEFTTNYSIVVIPYADGAPVLFNKTSFINLPVFTSTYFTGMKS